MGRNGRVAVRHQVDGRAVGLLCVAPKGDPSYNIKDIVDLVRLVPPMVEAN
jgi:hypothetical protein